MCEKVRSHRKSGQMLRGKIHISYVVVCLNPIHIQILLCATHVSKGNYFISLVSLFIYVCLTDLTISSLFRSYSKRLLFVWNNHFKTTNKSNQWHFLSSIVLPEWKNERVRKKRIDWIRLYYMFGIIQYKSITMISR